MTQFAREYPDSTVTVGTDIAGRAVTISRGADLWKWQWNADSASGEEGSITLTDSGQSGNILLSKLRAFYTFKTFDAEMLRTSEQYKNLRRQGRVYLDAEGYGVDVNGYSERHLRDDPQSRRIEIYLDALRTENVKTFRRPLTPGSDRREARR
jgi:hypothetical protein